MRLLTSEEIEEILDFIKPCEDIPIESAIAVCNVNKQRLREQLKIQKIYPEIIPKLKNQIQKNYWETRMQPGESVGVLCAQSIGQKQTQCTLNTFHKAGASEKTMTTGVPRFQELINVTKKPRIVNHRIYFHKKHSSIDMLRDTIGSTIVGLTLKDLAYCINVELNKQEEPWYNSYSYLYDDKFLNHDHCLSIKFNMQKIFEFKINIQSIIEFLQNEYDDLHCVMAPESIGQLDIFVDCDTIELPAERIQFVDSTNAIEIYLEECVQPTLEKINLCGIPCINEIFYVKEKDDWSIETTGINSRQLNIHFLNFKSLLALKQVDETRTISNNVWDIYDVLGIEAARQFLIEEFMNVLEGINPCHPGLLVDRMTHNGVISSITRYTMKKSGGAVFSRASFEETMDNFLNTAASGEVEPTRGVSASIICGKRSEIGTGMMNLSIDIDSLTG